MLLLDGVRRSLHVRVPSLAGLAGARAAAHFRSAIGGDCSHGCRARAAAFRSGIGGDCSPLGRVLAGSTGAAGSGVQRFWRRFSCEIRLVASLGIVSGPSRGVPKEFGFFDPLRPGQITNHGFLQIQIQGARFDRCLPAVEIWVSVVQSHY